MLEVRGDLYFGEKSFYSKHRAELGVEQLEGDVPVVADVAREIDCRHSARADLALDVVAVGKGSFELGQCVHGFSEEEDARICGRGQFCVTTCAGLRNASFRNPWSKSLSLNS